MCTAAVAAAVANRTELAAAVADGAVQPVPRPPPIKGGGSTTERLNCCSNFSRLVLACLTIACQFFEDDWMILLPELPAVATAVAVTPTSLSLDFLPAFSCSFGILFWRPGLSAVVLEVSVELSPIGSYIPAGKQ